MYMSASVIRDENKHHYILQMLLDVEYVYDHHILQMLLDIEYVYVCVGYT